MDVPAVQGVSNQLLNRRRSWEGGEEGKLKLLSWWGGGRRRRWGRWRRRRWGRSKWRRCLLIERQWIIHHFPAVLSISLLKLKLPYVHHVFHPIPNPWLLFHFNDSILSFVRHVFLVLLLPLSSPVSKFSSRCPPLTCTSTFSPFTMPLSASKLTSKIFPESRAGYPPAFSGDIVGSMLAGEFIRASRCIGDQFGDQPHALRKICGVVSFVKPWCKLLSQESIFLLALALAPSLYRNQVCWRTPILVFWARTEAGNVFWSGAEVRGAQIMKRVRAWEHK